MKKIKQDGFGFIGILVLVLVIGLVAGIGWYILKSKKPPVTTQSATCANNWLAFKPAGGTYEICLPDGWALNELNGTDVLYANKNTSLTYRQGTSATVSKLDMNNSDFVAFEVSPIGDIQLPFKGEKSTLMNNTGLALDKFAYIQTEEPSLMDTNAKGTAVYAYVARKGQRIIRIYYRVPADEKNDIHLIEQVVKTLIVL